MSDFGEAVMAVLSDRWQSTVEIADRVPMAESDTYTHRRKAYKHLSKALVWGRVEKDLGPASSGGKVAYWKLKT
jgi:hypothetical protein